MTMSQIGDYPNEGIPCLPVFVCPGKMGKQMIPMAWFINES